MSRSLKHLALVMLVVQNTALGIMSKFSRTADGPKYKPGTVVFLVEVVKFFICFLVLCKLKHGDVRASVRALRFEVFADTQGLQKMVVLAFLYAVQNMMALVAFDYVDVATYQIVYQLKIITTAMFMIVLLHRRFSVIQWGAMVTLMVGVAICSNSRSVRKDATAAATDPTDPTAADGGVGAAAAHATLDSARIIGVSIVLGLAVNSGLAAAYFERVMKTHRPVRASAALPTLDPLWVRNLQLSAVSIAVCALDLVRNARDVYADGFFAGFNASVWVVLFLQAVGGLTVAAVVRYSDNVVKNFGTAFSLVLSCMISNYMFDERAPASFYVGVVFVVASVVVYGDSRFAVKDKVGGGGGAAPSLAVAPSFNSKQQQQHAKHSHEIRIESSRSQVTTRASAAFSVIAV